MPYRHLTTLLSRMLCAAALALASLSAYAENPAVVTGKAALRNVAAEMTALYANTVSMCPYDTGSDPDPDRPAFLCSGIIIRTAANDPSPQPTYFVWSIAPSSSVGTGQQHTGAGAVSFSWIRREFTFADLGASGYTLFPLYGPYSAHDSRKMSLKVICGFPMDAWTNFRTDKGCGAGTDPNRHAYVPGGANCQDQGILTGQDWVTHYLNPPYGTERYFYQCGIDVFTSKDRRGGLRNGQAFQIWMVARGLMAQKDAWGTFKDRNELRVEDWPASTPPVALPIQSFYYTAGNQAGRADAQKSQYWYYRLTGTAVPVVQITVPTMAVYTTSYDDPRVAFHFAQYAEDQVIQ